VLHEPMADLIAARIERARRRPSACLAMAVAISIAASLSGCANGGSPGDMHRATEYVGAFTGRFVDGLPLYRLPPVHVVGTRRSSDAD
jgi:hypothetical protein